MAYSETQDQRALNDLEFLAQISQMVTTLDRDRLLERVIELTVKALGAERASILLHPEHSNYWERVVMQTPQTSPKMERYSDSTGEASLHFARRVLDKGLAGWVMRHRQAAIIYDTQTDDRWITFPDSTSAARSVLCVPFLYNDTVLGVLTVIHVETNFFTEHDLRLLTIVANQATVAIRNAQLFHQMTQQQRQLEAVLHAMPDLLLVLDEHGQLLLANDAAAHLLQEDAVSDHVIHQPLSAFVANDNALAMVYDIVSSPVQSGQTWSFETRSENLRRDFMVTITVWESASGGMAGYVVVMRDITTLRDLNRFKDEMLQMASHDLRSPLALIVGYSSLIALDTSPDSPVNEYLNIIQQATERMRGLLDDLLRVEQIRTSPLEMNEQVDFGELVSTALNHARAAADSKGHYLSAKLELADAPGILLNPVLIRESMENLLLNAIKYTPDGGRIIVRAYLQGDRAHFIVEDNGIGIPKQSLPRVFEAFYRVKGDNIPHVEGRGLGLSLVKTIIERHNGEVWVESEQGKGSRFGFWLPVKS